MRYDVVIVGARVAGAATALLLARKGLRVLVVDRGRYGSDTLSTHALMRGAVLQLHRWGLLDQIKDRGTPPIRSATFHYDDDIRTVPIKARGAADALYAPRRTVLDQLLVDAATEAGADLMFGVRAAELIRTRDGRVRGVVARDPLLGVHEILADVVVGADGLRSTIARLAGAAHSRTGRHASGVVYARWAGVALEGYHWYYSAGLSAGSIPTNDGESCVFVAVPAARFGEAFGYDIATGYHAVLARCAPGLAKAVATARRASAFHGFSGEPGFMRESCGPGWALVGDAGYYRDPLTAHGITDALRDAELLAEAILQGSAASLDSYQRHRDEIARPVFEISDELASFAWDLTTVRTLHESLAKAMADEVRSMSALMGHRDVPVPGPTAGSEAAVPAGAPPSTRP